MTRTQIKSGKFSVTWTAFGRAHPQRGRVADVVASLIGPADVEFLSDGSPVINPRRAVYREAAEQLPDWWDIDSIESVLDGVTFEVAPQ